MPPKSKSKVEFGDFQTPPELAREVCAALRRSGLAPASVLEPTCGTGAFLVEALSSFPTKRAVGFDINPDYVAASREALATLHLPTTTASVDCADFFSKDWPAALDSLPEPLLVIGNPPWVTNAAVGSVGGSNLPAKSNFQGHSGFDALTGKSNFDISEWMLLHLLDWLSGRRATLAMLCKTVVARKVLHHAWSKNLELAGAALYRIDAARHFGAAVDACLFVCNLAPQGASTECAVYSELGAESPESMLALRDGELVADLANHTSFGHLAGTSPLRWRSGVKHDCSRVMELRPAGEEGVYINGLKEEVRLEDTYLFPMLKSSETAKPVPTPTRVMLVPQRSVGDDTSCIEERAPLTWSYLLQHADKLDRRGSSIYRKRPRFSVFGIGPYTFAPWKVAISGFYKQLGFRSVGPIEGKPVVLDDTCYFLPCSSEEDAAVLMRMLNSKEAQGFFQAFIFWDAKRPITAQLLARLDLCRLAEELGLDLPVWSPPVPNTEETPLFSTAEGV